MTTAAANIESLGHLGARAGVPLSRVQRVVKALGIKPTLVVDDVDFLTEDDVQRVAEHLAGNKHEQRTTR